MSTDGTSIAHPPRFMDLFESSNAPLVFTPEFLIAAGTAGAASLTQKALAKPHAAYFLPRILSETSDKMAHRIVDMHVHFDEKNPNFVADLVKVSERLNMTACVLTPFQSQADRRSGKTVSGANSPVRLCRSGRAQCRATGGGTPHSQLPRPGRARVREKPYTDPSYMPVYELANRYGWIVLFHTGIVLRKKFDEPEDVASHRMRAFYLEEIARRFPKITGWSGPTAGIQNISGRPRSHAGTLTCSSTSVAQPLQRCMLA